MRTENPKKFWNAISKAPTWREYILPKRTDKEFDNEGLAQAKDIEVFYSGSKTIIDYGCGIGRVLKYIDADRKIGLDIVPDFIKKASEIDNTSEYYVIDEFINENFSIADFVYCLSVIQHNVKDERINIVKNIYDLLKDGGVALISFPHEDSRVYNETEFVHKFTREEVEEFGRIFGSYEIIESNLVNYGDGQRCQFNEYLLLGTK